MTAAKGRWPVDDDAPVAPGEVAAARRLLRGFRVGVVVVTVVVAYVVVAIVAPELSAREKALVAQDECQVALGKKMPTSLSDVSSEALIHRGAGVVVVEDNGVYALFVDGERVSMSGRCTLQW